MTQLTPPHARGALLAALLGLAGSTRPLPTPASRLRDDPRGAMLAALGAEGPHASLGSEAAAFDHFVGTWDADFTAHGDDGSVQHATGELHFGWVLDGRALQDIWIAYPAPGSSAERELGTTVRVYDPEARTWRVVWISASHHAIVELEGGPVGERIVLHGRDTDGALLRWSFEEIRPDSFRWRGEASRDEGQTWRLQEDHRMRRRPSKGR